eukprot:s760_g4.t1
MPAREATGYVVDGMLCHYVTQAYGDCSEDDGYLVLKEGQVVFVEYVGCDGHEKGWLFGYKSGSEDHHGWFPDYCIEKISPPPGPPVPPNITSRATPSPLRNVPSYVLNGYDKVHQEERRRQALDSFARIPTPPPEEEIFQRQITPPPDDDDDICNSDPWLTPEADLPPPPPAPKGQPISQLPPPGLDSYVDAEPWPHIGHVFVCTLKDWISSSVAAGLEAGKDLPMYQYRDQLKRKVTENRVVMVDAATGSGKSTLEGRSCRIVVTQPRRMAAKKLAERVSDQVKRDVGTLIGYRVGGQDKNDHPQGLVVYVTVGHFLEALVHNPRLGERCGGAHLENFSHVVLDEVHERFVEADFLMALLRMLLSRPESLRTRIVVTLGRHDFHWEIWTLKKSTTRSDKLTSACQKLAAIGAKWIKHLKEVMHINVVLAFLPGLDQIPGRSKGEVSEMPGDDNDYKRAGDPVWPEQWKVIIATNMAESSLTLPNVGAVLDFGMHRVNEYNDESKMSTLVTTWCSKASLKQRRGRTGRTNDGKYYCMMERRVYEQLEDYDQSGVERSSLTKVALEAAYLADVLSRVPQIRAGLPTTVPGREGGRIVEFFDGDVGLWRIGVAEWAAEEERAMGLGDLRLSELHLIDVLKLLPSPPKTTRIQTAITDLQEFGTLTAGERPTALGIACLKLPAEVHLARLVVLGWTMGMGPSACVLAAALSLTPSCDVFLTPMNTQGDLDKYSLDLLQMSISARTKYDGGWLSEPLTMYALCEKWLQKGGGLGSVPNIDESRCIVHQRLWSQFSAKVVDLWRAMQRLVPWADRQSYHDLRALQDLARQGYSPFGSRPVESLLEQDKEKLLALLTWGLAPGPESGTGWQVTRGFLAIGQSPSIYGKGPYGEFWSSTQDPKLEQKWDVADCLYWKRPRDDVAYALRLGGFKALNWYMPYRSCEGLKEVCLNWKSPAYSLLNTTRRWPDRCRPKRFLVASGGDYRTDYHGDTKTRVTMLRGISVLPSRDGGRQALLWFLAAGVPRDAQMTALCAPCEAPGGTLDPKHFEVRGLWMTLRLPNSAIITSADLKAVNDFRQALKKMQSYQPHRLAGTWYAEDAAFRIDCLEDENGEDGKEGRHDVLVMSKLFAPYEDARKLYPCAGGWSGPDGGCILEELPKGLRYEGRMLTRSTEELAILEQFHPKSLQAGELDQVKLSEMTSFCFPENDDRSWEGTPSFLMVLARLL